jgi:spore coat protein CotH
MADDQVYAAFCQMMDMDAFIDYLVAQSFFGNYDIHNQNWWNAGDRIRWQPILYDVDRCLNETSANSNVLGMYFNSNGVVHNQLGDKILMEIPCGLKKNASWRQRFVERYAELLCTEFREDRLLALLDEMAAALRPEMAEHTARWKMPESVSAWEKNVRIMRQCISQRYAVVAGQIKRQFSLSDAEWNALMAKYGGR